MRQRFILPLVLLIGMLCMPLLAPPIAAAQSAGVWSRIVGMPTTFSPSAIAYADPTRAWAVGVQTDETHAGAIVQLDLGGDGVWRAAAVYPTAHALVSVLPLGRDDVWVGGEQALVARLTDGVLTSATLTSDMGVSIRVLASDGGTTIVAAGFAPLPQQNQYRGFAWIKGRASAWVDMALPASVALGRLSRAAYIQGELWLASNEHIVRSSTGGWVDMTPAYCETGTFCSQGIVDLASASSGPIALVARQGGCAICTTHTDLLRWSGSAWETQASVAFNDQNGGALSGVVAAGDVAMAVGASTRRTGKFSLAGLVLTRNGGGWSQIGLPSGVNDLEQAALLDADHALVLERRNSILTYGYPLQAGLALDATVASPDPQQPGVDYFGETGHTLRSEFRNRWRQYGGLAQFGYPLTDEVTEVSRTDGRTYLVQYFERARFELHAELPRPYNVLLGLLGRSAAAGREAEAPFVARAGGGPGYAPETGHTIAPEFLGYWQARGGLAIFGYPTSELFVEGEYLVQYFERNRFELHPELPEPYRVSLGLLGVRALERAGVR